MLSVKLVWPVACVGLLCGLSGCSRGAEFLIFNYQTITLSDAAAADALVDDISNGRTTVAATMRSPCNHTADMSDRLTTSQFSTRPPPVGNLIAEMKSSRAVNIATTNNPACPVITSYSFVFGDPLTFMRVGNIYPAGDAEVTFANGQLFEVIAFAQSRPASLSQGNVRGEFSYVNKPAVGSNTLLLIDGSFRAR
jgi:hypothetical protein